MYVCIYVCIYRYIFIADRKFHGVIAATAPTGCFKVSICRPGVGEASVWPETRFTS